MLDDEYKNWIIKPDKISLTTINNHLQILKNNGNTITTVQDWISFIQREQEKTLENWFNFFKANNLDQETKEWILNSIKRMAKLNKITYQFQRRNIHTIHPFPEINKEIITKIITKEETVTFKNIYEQMLKILLEQKSNIGIWKTYHNPNDFQKLSNSLQGYYTNWCITNEEVAYLHLLAGKIDVFYTEIPSGNLYPRLAIGRNNKEINRCIGIEINQGIEKELIPEVLKHIADLDLPLNETIKLKLVK